MDVTVQLFNYTLNWPRCHMLLPWHLSRTQTDNRLFNQSR